MTKVNNITGSPTIKRDFKIASMVLVGVSYTIIKKDTIFVNLFDYIWTLATLLLGTYLLVTVIFFFIKRNKGKKYLHFDFRQIDKMNGLEFEALLAEYFKQGGYHVILTPPSNDYGADLVLGLNGESIAVQAKRYTGHKVGNKAVQEIVAAMPYYNATKGMVVTNSYFTKSAKELAKVNNVILWDRNKLKEIFQIVEYNKQNKNR